MEPLHREGERWTLNAPKPPPVVQAPIQPNQPFVLSDQQRMALLMAQQNQQYSHGTLGGVYSSATTAAYVGRLYYPGLREMLGIGNGYGTSSNLSIW